MEAYGVRRVEGGYRGLDKMGTSGYLVSFNCMPPLPTLTLPVNPLGF